MLEVKCGYFEFLDAILSKNNVMFGSLFKYWWNKRKKKVTKAIDNSVSLTMLLLLYAAHFASTARFTAEYKSVWLNILYRI